MRYVLQELWVIVNPEPDPSIPLYDEINVNLTICQSFFVQTMQLCSKLQIMTGLFCTLFLSLYNRMNHDTIQNNMHTCAESVTEQVQRRR